MNEPRLISAALWLIVATFCVLVSNQQEYQTSPLWMKILLGSVGFVSALLGALVLLNWMWAVFNVRLEETQTLRHMSAALLVARELQALSGPAQIELLKKNFEYFGVEAKLGGPRVTFLAGETRMPWEFVQEWLEAWEAQPEFPAQLPPIRTWGDGVKRRWARALVEGLVTEARLATWWQGNTSARLLTGVNHHDVLQVLGAE